jgi:hypothetical protein
MGHAILDAMVRTSNAGRASGKRSGGTSTPVRIADHYLRLKETAESADSTVPVGPMMVDHSEWAPGAANEHPWADADEFFASARAAYVLNVKG